ncbi:UDP-glucose 6-dehydrogenase TuaD [compost metagenome]
MDGLDYAKDPYEAATEADVLVIVTEWNEFRALDFRRLKAVMKEPVLVDLRNIYRPEEVAKHGFAYTSVGKAG